jgi:hypothetical protein
LLLLALLFSGFNNLVSLPRFWILRYWWRCREGAEYVCPRKFGHSLCCGLCFLFFCVCFFASFVDVFVRVVKMYAVRECDRDGKWHAFWHLSIGQCWDSLCHRLF